MIEFLYTSRLGKYFDQYPQYRSFGLWFCAVICGVSFLITIFPVVAINDELNEDGGAKTVYENFSKMLWGQYSDKISMSGGKINVDASVVLTMVGFAMHRKIDSSYGDSEIYQYALWSDCRPADHTQDITPDAEIHRKLEEKTTAEYICDAKDSCQVAFQNAEGLLGFTLFLTVVGTGVAAFRIYHQSSRHAHSLNSIVFFLVMLMTIIIVTSFNKDCVGSIESILEERRSTITGSTSGTSHRVGNVYNIFIAIAVLSGLVFSINFLIFPAPRDVRPREASGANRVGAPASSMTASPMSGMSEHNSKL